MVCLSVEHVCDICIAKTAEPIEVRFGVWTQSGPNNDVLDGVLVLCQKKGQFGRGRGWPTVKYRVIPSKINQCFPLRTSYFA